MGPSGLLPHRCSPARFFQGVVVPGTTRTWRDFSGALGPQSPSVRLMEPLRRAQGALGGETTGGNQPWSGKSDAGRALCQAKKFSFFFQPLGTPPGFNLPTRIPRPRVSRTMRRLVPDRPRKRKRILHFSNATVGANGKRLRARDAKAFLVRVDVSLSSCLRGPLPRRRCPSRVPSGS